MGDFTIQISNNLVNQLVNESTKTKKAKPKPRQETKSPQQSQSKQLSDDSETLKPPSTVGWPIQPSVYLPYSQPKPVNAELEAIQSVVRESENVVERLRKQEENMLLEVTERAKDLHDKEFKLPKQKPLPCSEKYEACKKCYNEYQNDPLKCNFVVNDYNECVRKVSKLFKSDDK